MITEKEYIEAQKIVDKYKSEQLNKHIVSGSLPVSDDDIEKIAKAKLKQLGAMEVRSLFEMGSAFIEIYKAGYRDGYDR